MPDVNRRRFLQIAGATAAATAMSQSVARAAAIPALRRTGTVRDVEHVVVLMQENRSFDHYYGTLRGVRGFSDPRAVTLPNGRPVWDQSDPHGVVAPFRPDIADFGIEFLQGLDHGWDSGHQAFANGRYDQWLPAKSGTTMTHMRRSDMPFHYSLADAFTICDAYHCSLLGPTDPNRYYMWSGYTGNDGRGGGPVLDDAEAGYSWSTYPERLQRAGVNWKIYQDIGTGLDADGSWGWTNDPYIGNYGDNSLLYFDAYRDAAPSSPLYQRARTGTNVSQSGGFFDQLRADVQADRLPQISWITAPEAFSEHPNWPVRYGEWYISQVLDALTSNPQVWASTVFFITYDENDGYFDHVVPPHANVAGIKGGSTVSTAGEEYTGTNGVTGPYGLGQRVPMVAVSPWSVGGWVCSETFDHTSIIRFMEQRFGVMEPNISPWRRTVCGDLTAAFDFRRTGSAAVPAAPPKPDDDSRHASYDPPIPRGATVPTQEPGGRPSRPVNYDLSVDAQLVHGELHAQLRTGTGLGAHFQARSNDVPGAPFSYTVGAHDTLSATWPVGSTYDVQVHGADGFLRGFTGSGTDPALQVTAHNDRATGQLLLTLVNTGASALIIQLKDGYSTGAGSVTRHTVQRHSTTHVTIETSTVHGWYDTTLSVIGHTGFTRHLAGRICTGQPSTSDPHIGASSRS